MPGSASNARLGYGTLLKRRISTSPDVYQLVAERVSLGGPSMSRDTPDVTHMDSPNGWREFLPGLKDGGEIPIEGNFVPDDPSHNVATGLLSEFYNDMRGHWRIEFPLTGSPAIFWEFDGILSGFDTDMPVDDKLSFTATVKLSGEPTLA
jgi:predicted secreted protein